MPWTISHTKPQIKQPNNKQYCMFSTAQFDHDHRYNTRVVKSTLLSLSALSAHRIASHSHTCDFNYVQNMCQQKSVSTSFQMEQASRKNNNDNAVTLSLDGEESEREYATDDKKYGYSTNAGNEISNSF